MKRAKEEDKDESASANGTLNSSAGSNSNDAAATTSTGTTTTATRTTGRVKKPKQVYDPSVNYVRYRNTTPANATAQTAPMPAPAATATATAVAPVRVTSPVAVAATRPDSVANADAQDAESGAQPLRQHDICHKCKQMEVKRGSGHKSNFLGCKSCLQKWHFSCMSISFDVLSVARKKYKCPSCRYCRICGDKGTDLAICSTCVYSFHRDCHDPPLSGSDLSERQWQCHSCEHGSNHNNNNNNTSGGEQTGRKSYPGRMKRAQSDPAGQEKQAKLVKESKEETKSAAEAEPKRATKKKEKAAEQEGEHEQDKEVRDKKEELEPQSELKEEADTRLSTDELDMPMEAAAAVEEPKAETKEEPEVMPAETMPEPMEQETSTETEHQAVEAEAEAAAAAPAPPQLVEQMPLGMDMDQQPLEAAAVPNGSDDDEISDVSVQPPLPPPPLLVPLTADDVPVISVNPVSSWTTEQVTAYVSHFYPEEAQALNMQDMDGEALMMLTREDMINGFGFKFGQALRVKKPKQVYDPSVNYVRYRNTTPANATAQTAPMPAPAATATATAVAPVRVTSPVAVAATRPDSVANADAQDAESGAQPLRQHDICHKCKQMEVKRGSGHKSNFLGCKSCLQKWHFSCMSISFDVLSVARKKYKCPSCRYCRICGAKGTDLAICSTCVYSFHRDCHDPPLSGSDLSERQWQCHSCEHGSNHNNNNNNTSGGEQTGRKSYPGRMKRAQSDPAGQEKQAKLVKESKEETKSAAEAEPKRATKKKEKAAEQEGEHEQDKEVRDKKEELEPQSELKEEADTRLSTDELDMPMEAAAAVEEPKAETKEEPEVMPAETMPEPMEQETSTETEHQAVEAEAEAAAAAPAPPQLVEQMPLGMDMDQQPLEAAAVPNGSDDDEISDVSVQPPLPPPPLLVPLTADDVPVISVNPVSSWTTEQVTAYVSHFYPEEAQALNRQDMDGEALMMLTREDMINGFGFKFGQALRVFQVILGLQMRNNNVSLGWSST
ncbi:histone-lysine N-methyltransferase 2D-like [Drosophila madeirensis]|uniref:Histone-lysine N-methyltransferase 2D-like n=1 Tax=Drosophila madeirensis TaxID=30013 RepID=A0AAU9FYN5_DROMD